MEQLDLSPNRLLEPSSELGERAAGACPEHNVEGLSIRPGEFPTERCKNLEELAVAQQQASLIFESRRR